VDCFGNGLEDISLDVVAVEVWAWELLFYSVHQNWDICGYMGVAVNAAALAAISAHEMVLAIPTPLGFT